MQSNTLWKQPLNISKTWCFFFLCRAETVIQGFMLCYVNFFWKLEMVGKFVSILQHLITYKTILVFLLLKLFSIEVFPLPQLRNSIFVSCNWKAVSKWKQGVIPPPKCAHYVVISWKIKNHSRSKDWNFFLFRRVCLLCKHLKDTIRKVCEPKCSAGKLIFKIEILCLIYCVFQFSDEYDKAELDLNL